jgi:hypothetical protein
MPHFEPNESSDKAEHSNEESIGARIGRLYTDSD